MTKFRGWTFRVYIEVSQSQRQIKLNGCCTLFWVYNFSKILSRALFFISVRFGAMDTFLYHHCSGIVTIYEAYQVRCLVLLVEPDICTLKVFKEIRVLCIYQICKLGLELLDPLKIHCLLAIFHILFSEYSNPYIYIYIYNCWKKSKLKSYVRPWFHG